MEDEDPDSLPLIVTDKERLARAIFFPNYINKSGKLKPSAFKAPSGRQDVSVNRLVALNADACKVRSKAITLSGTFKGFAVLTAYSVRECGSDVKDSRAAYLGHADIIHDQILPKNEPPPPEFNERLKRLVEASQYFPDPDPESDTWTGEDFSAGH